MNSNEYTLQHKNVNLMNSNEYTLLAMFFFTNKFNIAISLQVQLLTKSLVGYYSFTPQL